MSVHQFVTSSAPLYSHKFSNLKFKGDAPQAECVVHVKKGFVSAQRNLYKGNYDAVAQLECSMSIKGLHISKNYRGFICSIVFRCWLSKL
jgi:hypothetical protein